MKTDFKKKKSYKFNNINERKVFYMVRNGVIENRVCACVHVCIKQLTLWLNIYLEYSSE